MLYLANSRSACLALVVLSTKYFIELAADLAGQPQHFFVAMGY